MLVPCMLWGEGGLTNLLGLAVGVEEGQAIEALVVLREAAQAEEESTDTHLHQHVALLCPLSREGLGHLHNLWRGLGPPLVSALPIAGRSLGGGLRSGGLGGDLGSGRGLWWGGWNRQCMRAGIYGRLSGISLRYCH